MTAHDIDMYRDCMVELKARVMILDDALLPFRKGNSVSVANTELACLQLRKVYELIAFASMSANRGKYQELRSSFQKDWDLPRICRRIHSLNPHFLPRRFWLEDDDLNPNSALIQRDEPILSMDELLRRHGELGLVLHARNPYAASIDYRAWSGRCCEERDKLVVGLSNHVATVVDGEIFYSVSMNVDNSGLIQVTPWYAMDDQT